MKTLMHRTRRFASRADIPKTYRGLCELYLPRPIHNDAQDEEATTMMNALVGFPRFNAEQQDYLDVLTEFVDEYDQGKKIRWPKISGLDTLKCLLEENGMSAADLSRILGTSRNLGAMILRGERQLTLAHVRTLAKHFSVSADLFLPTESN
jgi:HTH-type transcriptional regulator/antitoxin HigA